MLAGPRSVAGRLVHQAGKNHIAKQILRKTFIEYMAVVVLHALFLNAAMMSVIRITYGIP
jgi:hypothetical protein